MSSHAACEAVEQHFERCSADLDATLQTIKASFNSSAYRRVPLRAAPVAARLRKVLTNFWWAEPGGDAASDQGLARRPPEAVSYTHLTLPTIYSV